MFQNYKIIKTKHSKKRMEDRNISDIEINNTIQYGILLEENTLFYNNLYLIFVTNKYKRTLVIITLIKGNEHLLTLKEKNIILRLNKLINCDDSELIQKELTECWDDFVQDKILRQTNGNFEFTNLLNYSDPFVVNILGKNIVFNEDKKSIVMKVMLGGNLVFLDKVISDYSVNVGVVKKVYSIVFKTIKKIKTKMDNPELKDEIEKSTENFIKSLNLIIDIYKNKNQPEYIEQLINSKSSDGYTPLMLSMYKGLDKLSCFFIENGANISNDESNINKRGESITDLFLLNKDFLLETSKFILL